MNRRHAPLWAKGLLVLTTLVLSHPAARAGCHGCGAPASLIPSPFACLHNGCHYKPGKCPTLCNPENFGYYPTVWTLWPATLDPNTSYPSAPAVMPPAGNDSADHTLSIPAPHKTEKADQAIALPAPAKAEKAVEKPKSPYALIPAR